MVAIRGRQGGISSALMGSVLLISLGLAVSGPTLAAGPGKARSKQQLTLSASVSSLSFGNVNLGTSSTLPVTLTNLGNSNIDVSNVSVSGPGFTVSGLSTGQILSSGQTATLNVTFAPAASGSVTGSATVTSNAGNSPTVIALSGSGTSSSHSASLSWTGSNSVVIGYNVYRGGISGGPYTRLTGNPVAVTDYLDTAVQANATYYYVVTAIDASNDESAFSNEVAAVVP
jgi:hypothetical protein